MTDNNDTSSYARIFFSLALDSMGEQGWARKNKNGFSDWIHMPRTSRISLLAQPITELQFRYII